jgi:competence protein ComEA
MKWLKDYFDLNRKEEIGILALIFIIIFLFGLQFIWIYIIPKQNYAISPSTRQFDSLIANQKDSSIILKDSSFIAETELVNFDPNTISEEGLINLGISKIIASHVIHYREKGGHFYKADDLSRIYGLTNDEFNVLKPYIVISSDIKTPSEILVDLNKADSLDLLSIKGIGPVFASRILLMRCKLGCFVNKNQLLDIYGIDEQRYSFIQSQVFITKMHIHSLNINSATSQELNQNPYIRYKLANIIVKYREVNGPFKTVEDLKKIIAIDDKAYAKMSPYLSVN